MKTLKLLLVSLPLSLHGSTLFSDLGSSGTIYNPAVGWDVAGSSGEGPSAFSEAGLFTVSSSGTQSVSQIDLGVFNTSGATTFDASIWTDVGGEPGMQVANASWDSLPTSETGGDCCELTSIAGISGVTLAGGASYFMVIGPVSVTDDSFNGWNWNNQGLDGLDLYSQDGGTTWNSHGTGNPLGAFNVLGSALPEPGTAALLGAGSIGIAALRRWLTNGFRIEA
jgi:hypothetical protein